MKKIRERDIERYLVNRVKDAGGEVRKLRWIGRRGAPDRLVMLPAKRGKRSKALWIELKAPGKKATLAQQREHDSMRRFGQCVVVVDSFEKVDEVLA